MTIEREHSTVIADGAGQSTYAPILADNVKRMRTCVRINKKQFALMVGIGRPFLNKIEDGTANPRLAIIEKLAAAFETTPDFLLAVHTDEDIRREVQRGKDRARKAEARNPQVY